MVRKYAVIALLSLGFLTPAFGQEDPAPPAAEVAPAEVAPEEDPYFAAIASLPWKSAPEVGVIGDVAQIALEGDLHFLDEEPSSSFLEINGNLPTEDEYVLAPESLRWFATFYFEEVGYVRDTDQIDPDALMASMREGNAAGNEQRRSLGLETLELQGWSVEPHYDAATNRLEWGTQLIAADGTPIVNYTIRILGRTGVMNALLVSSPDYLQDDITEFKTALASYDFVGGQRYDEFQEGDRIAEFGLAALVVGGAAAVAANTGLLQSLGKFIWVGLLGAFAAVSAFFRRLFGRRSDNA